MKLWVFWLILVCVVCGMFELLTPATPFTDALNWIFELIINFWTNVAAWFKQVIPWA